MNGNIIAVGDLRDRIEERRGVLRRSVFRIIPAATNNEALTLHGMERASLIAARFEGPGMRGDELCCHVRADDSLRNVSLVLVSQEARKDESATAGCAVNAWLTEPIRSKDLVETIRQVMQVARRQAYRVVVHVQVDGRHGHADFVSQSHNMSVSGMLIETSELVAVGTGITCSFFLPGSKRIVAAAEVVRHAEAASGKHQYGLRFAALDDASRSAINAFVNGRR